MLKVSPTTLKYLPIIAKVLLSGRCWVSAAVVSETGTSEIWVTKGGTRSPSAECIVMSKSADFSCESFY